MTSGPDDGAGAMMKGLFFFPPLPFFFQLPGPPQVGAAELDTCSSLGKERRRRRRRMSQQRQWQRQ